MHTNPKFIQYLFTFASPVFQFSYFTQQCVNHYDHRRVYSTAYTHRKFLLGTTTQFFILLIHPVLDNCDTSELSSNKVDKISIQN